MQPRAAHISYQKLNQAQLDAIVKSHEVMNAGRVGGARAVLSYKDLTGLTLKDCNLADAEFTGAILQRTEFDGATLDRANFFGADLRRASLVGASLRRADLRGASLRGADLTRADLFEADLREGSIAERDRKGNLRFLQHEIGPTELPSALLASSNLEGAKLSGIVAVQADFTDAIMRNCRLVRANLRQAKLAGAVLENADLSGADLSGADLEGAILSGAKLAMTVFDHANMDDVLMDEPAEHVREFSAPVLEMLRSHDQWARSGGSAGKPCSLKDGDLRELKSIGELNLTALVAPNAIFYGLDMRGVKLQGAQLVGADLRSVNLEGADLRGVNLRGAKLNNAKFNGAKCGPLALDSDRFMVAQFDKAKARYADFDDCDLTNAQLTAIDASFARFIGANLKGTDFSDATLNGAQIAHSSFAEAKSIGATGVKLLRG